ncbi:hypothetical protein [Taklimakanibacter deserti]|uniref:hypothetical protein n=1 Tax=Taklimakanibacter deserti TaxID=2267839 RepID=UPI000E645F71
MTVPLLTIANERLSVTLNPRVGGSITSITHRPSGLSVLGTVPWPAIDEPIASLAARDEPEWLTRYTGGWPLIFPNGGDACIVDGIFHGFHGEASIAPWSAVAQAEGIELTRRFTVVPVEMRRHLHLADDVLVIREHLRMKGDRPLDVMWGHHPTLGSDLLAGPVEITTGARQVTVDQTYDPPANPLRPGATGHWPVMPGKTAPVDLSRPCDSLASLVYLHDFDAAWIAVRRMDNEIAVCLSWDAHRFPCAWLWCELTGTIDPPWRGKTRLIGIEPNTTWPGIGLVKAKAAGGTLLRLHPGEELDATIRFRVFRPSA